MSVVITDSIGRNIPCPICKQYLILSSNTDYNKCDNCAYDIGDGLTVDDAGLPVVNLLFFCAASGAIWYFVIKGIMITFE